MIVIHALSAPVVNNGTDSCFLERTRAAQRARLIDTLKLGPINALEARKRLEVIDPQGRVLDLRLLGHNVTTNLVWVNARGRTTRVCVPEYRLLPGQYRSKSSRPEGRS